MKCGERLGKQWQHEFHVNHKIMGELLPFLSSLNRSKGIIYFSEHSTESAFSFISDTLEPRDQSDVRPSHVKKTAVYKYISGFFMNLCVANKPNSDRVKPSSALWIGEFWIWNSWLYVLLSRLAKASFGFCIVDSASLKARWSAADHLAPRLAILSYSFPVVNVNVAQLQCRLQAVFVPLTLSTL